MKARRSKLHDGGSKIVSPHFGTAPEDVEGDTDKKSTISAAAVLSRRLRWERIARQPV
jgi:hypothetical protein